MRAEHQDKLVTLQVIAEMESWWGAKFDESLIHRMTSAPPAHLREFTDYLFQDAPWVNLSEVRKGHLRPLITLNLANVHASGDANFHFKQIPMLALYSHEILLELPAAFFSEFDQASEFIELGETLNQLLKLNPLIESGVVTFYLDPMRSKNRHPSRNLLTRKMFEGSTDPGVIEAFGKLDAYMSNQDPDVARSLFFFGRNDVSYLLRTATDFPGFFNICKPGSVATLCLDVLLAASGLTRPDRGTQNLNNLLALDVPRLSDMTSNIASLRSRSDEFAEWRSRLNIALSSIEDIEDDDEQWAEIARNTLIDELSPISERLKKAVKRSPAMQATSSGMRTFSLAGIGTLTSGLMGGPLMLPVTGLATAKAVEVVATYIGARKQYRANKAVLDILVAFENIES